MDIGRRSALSVRRPKLSVASSVVFRPTAETIVALNAPAEEGVLRAIRLEPLLPTASACEGVVADILRQTPNGRLVAGYVNAVVEAQLALYDRTKAVAPWVGYLARDEQTRQLVGSCSFIADPSISSVEIAYFTFPPFEGAGVATAMARELLAVALRNGDPNLHAFTLPEQNASTCILQRLGFTHVGEAQDEEAGVVWRWERPRRSQD